MQKTCLQLLKAGYEGISGKTARNIKLPSGIHFKEQGGIVRLELSASGVTGNMQYDAGAFEAWCLALHRWCRFRVDLTWELPPEGTTAAQLCHYERFLYRVARFKALFSEWFVIEPSLEKEISKARALAQTCYLNVEDDKRDTTEKLGDNPERRMELMLLRSARFAEHYGLSDGTRDIHFPVGLFEGAKSRDTRIFPGGAANIDLVCLSGETFWLFELKAKQNYSVGVFTELFFYASVIRDALRGGHFEFVPARGETAIQPEALKSVTHIEAVMLAHKIHPLLDFRLISILNEAVEKLWNTDLLRAQVHFRADRLLADEPDLRIAPVE